MRCIKFLILMALVLPLYAEPTVHVEVLKVVDGDTIDVLYNGKKEAVRLIGIDTPEVYFVSDRKPGLLASKFVKGLVKKGDKVGLEFDVRLRDKYNRLLAYVWLKDGRMLNEVIVREGYAHVMTIPPTVRYVKVFRAAFRKAVSEEKGLWSKEYDGGK